MGGISGAGIQATIYSNIQGGLTSALSTSVDSLLAPKVSLAQAIAASNEQGAATAAPREARITLEYIPPISTSSPSQSIQATQANIATATTQRPASVIASSTAVAAQAPISKSTITLDVTLQNSNAIAEAMTETLRARQVTHNTAAGYYVDEWGLAPGSLEIVARVIFRTQPATQIQALRSWFQQTKRLTPFQPGSPGIVRFHDSYSGISLQLNLMDISLQRVADEPLRGLFTLHAEVIADLTNQATATTLPQSNQLSGAPGLLV